VQKHGKARTEEDDGEPEYRPSAFRRFSFQEIALVMVQSPGSGFVRLISVPIDCFQLIALIASIACVHVLHRFASSFAVVIGN